MQEGRREERKLLEEESAPSTTIDQSDDSLVRFCLISCWRLDSASFIRHIHLYLNVA